MQDIEDEQRRRTERKEELQRKREDWQKQEGNLVKENYQLKASLADCEKALMEANRKEERYVQLTQQLDKNAEEETRLSSIKQLLNRELLTAGKTCKESENAFEDARQV